MNTKYSKFNRSLIKILVLLAFTLGLFACGNDNSSSSDADLPPIAKAVVIGAPLIDNNYIVLAGSDVLISAKDSDGLDDPILQFNWVASSSSDASLTLSHIEASLFERTNTTKLFRAPAVKQSTQVTFELTVIDADGASATDSINITIKPFAKTKAFLNSNAINNAGSNQYELVVALALEDNEITASSFEVLIETLAQWRPKSVDDSCQFGENQDQCQLVIDAQTIKGEWPPQLNYDDTVNENSATAYFNPHFYINIPALNTDVINKNFEQNNRHKRIELHQVNSAFLTQRFTFVSADNTSRLIILNESGKEDSGLLNHVSSSVDSVSLKVDTLRTDRNLESHRSASAYYQLIDRDSALDTLNKWRNLKGFNDITSNTSSINHAIYTNNYDLGFGRDMFMRTDNCGNVYSYVDNYPTLENAIQKRNKFATVVMEYSGLLPESGDNCDQGEKFVKFYAYVPDETTGEMVRANSMNFDGRGEKFMPGVCTACHRGTIDNITQYIAGLTTSTTDNSEINALTEQEKLMLADLNSSFMPFDLDAFLYTKASDNDLVDPAINDETLTNEQVEQHARGAQQNSLRALNKAVLHSYLHKQESFIIDDDVKRERWQAPIDLMNTWYSSNITNLADLDLLDQQNFNGENVLLNWQGEEEIYHQVFAKYCRACHIQSPNVSINFAESEEFINAATRITKQVYNDYNMPMARLTSDRFWLDFNGGASAASSLQTFLEGHEQNIEAFSGMPTAVFIIKNSLTDTIVSTIDEINQLIKLDASSSLLVDNYLWSMTNDCASDAFLNTSGSIQASMINDISPCIYEIQLDVNNFFGQDSLIKTFIVDRSPQTVPINILINNTNSDLPFVDNIGANNYTPGDNTLTIDVDPYIIDRGDNIDDNQLLPLQIIISEFSIKNLLADNNNDGTLMITFPPLSGINSIIEYQVADFNDSKSNENEKGVISLNIKAIIPTLIQKNITSNSVSLNWTVPDNFEAESYKLYRNAECNGCIQSTFIIDGKTTSYTDNNLQPSTNYQYELEVIISEDKTKSNLLDVTTISVKPSGLVIIQDINKLTLTWNMDSQATLTEFKIYRSTGNDTTPSVLLTTVDSSARSYTDQGLTANSFYHYIVQAVLPENTTADSAVATSYTLIAPPSTLSVANITETSALLSWVDSNGIEDLCFIINNSTQCLVNGANFQYQVTNLISNTLYNFTVKARGINNQKSLNTSSSQITTKVSFTNDVYPLVLTSLGGASCTGCHNSSEFAPYDGSNNVKSSGALLTELLRTSINNSQKKYQTMIGCITSGCGSMASQTSPFNSTQKALYEKWIAENPNL